MKGNIITSDNTKSMKQITSVQERAREQKNQKVFFFHFAFLSRINQVL